MVLLALVVGSLAWVATRVLPGSVVYFVTPTELVKRPPQDSGERLRLGGLVIPGSARRTGDGVTFVVSDGTSRVTVLHQGSTPELFRSGIGVVLEGTYGADGPFRSDTMLIKHSEEYRPPRPGETPRRVEVRP